MFCPYPQGKDLVEPGIQYKWKASICTSCSRCFVTKYANNSFGTVFIVFLSTYCTFFFSSLCLSLKFLEYYRFCKTKYLVDSFYKFLCPIGKAYYTLLLYVSAIHMPGDTQQGQCWTQLLSISWLLLACVGQRHRWGECNKLCQGAKKCVKRVY